MELGLNGRLALVLGAGGGLGGGIARALAREGVRVAISDIDAAALSRTADAIGAAGGRARAFVADLGSAAQRAALLAQIEADYGDIDIVVNNSGGPPPAAASAVAPDEWARHFEAMVTALIDITDRALPGMRARRWGRIITSVSSGVIAPIPNLAISNTLRLALVGWSKSLATEVARDGITVNVVIPGRIDTDRTRSLDEARARREGRNLADVEQASAASIPLGRYGRAEEYANVVTFLASECASYMTGTVVRVDGGYIPSVF